MTEVTVLALDGLELREVGIPLVRPFRTSFGLETEKRAILIRALSGDIVGWGECVASPEPRYSEEWMQGAWEVLREHLGPSLLAGGPIRQPEDVGRRLAWARGHRMAKAALETAILDSWLKRRGESLAEHLAAVRNRVPCGVSVGIAPTIDGLLEEVGEYVRAGYRRVKLKIEPGQDVETVRPVRAAFPEMPLSVDANGAYSPSDMPTFRELDRLGLAMIEQPLDHEDLIAHARLQSELSTPICLDESIRSARDAAAALELGACRVINIKPGRVGGVYEARRIHDLCLAQGIPVWIGGMLETGVGRASNLALAALPGVTMPGDTSASDRYFSDDITEPFVLAPDGTMPVPSGPGIGVTPLPERLASFTVRTELIAM